jgi:hypothetical protein
MEHGQIVETIQQELEESSTRELSYADLQKRDAVTKGLRPRWNSETPKDYSVASTTPDIDAALYKAVNAPADPDVATAEIVADVMKRLAGDGDFRKTDEREPEEADEDDEPVERPAELEGDIAFLRAERKKGVDLYEFTHAEWVRDEQRGKQLKLALAYLDTAA